MTCEQWLLHYDIMAALSEFSSTLITGYGPFQWIFHFLSYPVNTHLFCSITSCALFPNKFLNRSVNTSINMPHILLMICNLQTQMFKHNAHLEDFNRWRMVPLIASFLFYSTICESISRLCSVLFLVVWLSLKLRATRPLFSLFMPPIITCGATSAST